MAQREFEWKRPSDGLVFRWHVLTVGDHMDLEAAYAAPSLKHLKPYALLAARLFHPETKGMGYPVEELRKWDEADCVAFNDEVSDREAARSAAFRKNASPGDAVAALAQAVEQCKAALVAAAVAMEQALVSARTAALPLEKPPA